jgi:hypothetical protein
VTGQPPAHLLRVFRRRLRMWGGMETPERGGREVQAELTRPVDPPERPEGQVEQR